LNPIIKTAAYIDTHSFNKNRSLL